MTVSNNSDSIPTDGRETPIVNTPLQFRPSSVIAKKKKGTKKSPRASRTVRFDESSSVTTLVPCRGDLGAFFRHMYWSDKEYEISISSSRALQKTDCSSSALRAYKMCKRNDRDVGTTCGGGGSDVAPHETEIEMEAARIIRSEEYDALVTWCAMGKTRGLEMINTPLKRLKDEETERGVRAVLRAQSKAGEGDTAVEDIRAVSRKCSRAARRFGIVMGAADAAALDFVSPPDGDDDRGRSWRSLFSFCQPRCDRD